MKITVTRVGTHLPVGEPLDLSGILGIEFELDDGQRIEVGFNRSGQLATSLDVRARDFRLIIEPVASNAIHVREERP